LLVTTDRVTLVCAARGTTLQRGWCPPLIKMVCPSAISSAAAAPISVSCAPGLSRSAEGAVGHRQGGAVGQPRRWVPPPPLACG